MTKAWRLAGAYTHRPTIIRIRKMWVWLISSIAGSILGNAADSWFADTRFGKWFYKTVDRVFTWSAKKLNIRILVDEDKWRKKYPQISFETHLMSKKIENSVDRILNLEQRVSGLEKDAD